MSENGATVSLFDAYQGHIGGMETVNPPAQVFHSVGAHARFDLSKHWLKTMLRALHCLCTATI